MFTGPTWAERNDCHGIIRMNHVECQISGVEVAQGPLKRIMALKHELFVVSVFVWAFCAYLGRRVDSNDDMAFCSRIGRHYYMVVFFFWGEGRKIKK